MSAEAHELPRKHRLRVEEFHRMGEAGIFHETSRVELIEGKIVDMTPIGTISITPHLVFSDKRYSLPTT